MPKLTISQIVGIVSLIAVLSGFILNFGGLPKAVAKLEEQTQQYQKDISEIKADQHYLREKTQDIIDLLKKEQSHA